ncbi:putative Tetratricopeptide SHNi-TPR domain-containing protein [Seiridium cardinale]
MADPTSIDYPILSAVPSTVASATVSAVGTPQSLPPMDPEEREKSIKVSLADLTAKATALYAQKKYDEASEVYARAAEMQAEFNGEMSPENADILFLYGRSLFKIGQSKSDVLGGAPAGEKKKPKANGATKTKKAAAETSEVHASDEIVKSEAEEIAEEKVAILAKNATESGLEDGGNLSDVKKPLFQFTGDENFEDSDEEDDDQGEGEEEDEEEEEDDLAVAFEVLDLSRVLFEKALEQTNESEGKEQESAQTDSPATRHINERLADTHDLLAEISLENEKYPLAINDARASLKYKAELYPEESEVRAEAHFKLSLALEFASVTTDEENKDDAPKTVDQGLRDEAAAELEKAIASTKLKLQNEEVNLATVHAPEENEDSRKKIAEVRDIIADMEQRLVELKKPPVDVEGVLGAENPMSGILGAALGESPAEAQARIAEAKKGANDLSGFVRKKEKKPDAAAPAPEPETNGKRKAEEPADSSEEAKKAKVEATAPATES